VRKGGALFYAFFAKDFDGALELRGLGPGAYRVTDYVGGRDLGHVSGPTGQLKARFERSLLLEVRPD
jgi:alpha-galactosidase